MATNSTSYLTELHQLIDRYFSLEEVRTICFDLNVDFDSLGGEGKSPKIRELILALARVDRLQELVNLVEWQRPNVDWSAVPEAFELPAPPASPSASGSIQHIYHGDVFQGDKVGGDKIAGDQIKVGDISDSSNVAIGRGASASSTTGDSYDMLGDFRGANLNIKSRLQDASQSIGALPQVKQSTKDELQQLIVQLNDSLQGAPAEKTADAEKVSQATKLFVGAGAAEEPDQTLVEMLGFGLKTAASTLKDELPAIIDITIKIVAAVTAIAGIVG